ncbi:MAG: dihydrolipoamide acetyltransferase family protein, partial [Saprospiraceae bacterium]
MAEVIRMPRMSDTMEEGNILVWHKKVGDDIKIGDVLAEVETDKATMDLESFYDGNLLYIGVEKGVIAVNAVLAVIGNQGEDYKIALGNNGVSSGEQPKVAPIESKATPASPEDSSPPSESAPIETPNKASPPSESAAIETHIKASPLAKAIAKEEGLDLSNLSGSGDQGRIIKRDVESAILSKSSTTTATSVTAPSKINAPIVPPSAGQAFEDKPLSQMRKTIAKRLSESMFTAPHFYVTMAIDMTKAFTARTVMNTIAPSKLSFNDLVVKACAMALRKHPAINSSWTGEAIRQNNQINIGIAVAVTDGLLVPVIRHTDIKTLTQINAEVQYLAGRAKEKKLQPDEMQGNTFTIS